MLVETTFTSNFVLHTILALCELGMLCLHMERGKSVLQPASRERETHTHTHTFFPYFYAPSPARITCQKKKWLVELLVPGRYIVSPRQRRMAYNMFAENKNAPWGVRGWLAACMVWDLKLQLSFWFWPSLLSHSSRSHFHTQTQTQGMQSVALLSCTAGAMWGKAEAKGCT